LFAGLLALFPTDKLALGTVLYIYIVHICEMILNTRPLFVIVLLLVTACSAQRDKTTGNDSAIVNQTAKSALPGAKATYMPTGFYYLADSLEGIKMRKRGSDEFYTIAPAAFASVRNIANTKLKKTNTDKGVYTELCMTFDAKGANDLAEGTGNLLHPKIAVVVANQLLYVVDNTAKIKTGVMFISLEGYTDPELKTLQDEVGHKR
jgi:hypothetical protein